MNFIMIVRNVYTFLVKLIRIQNVSNLFNILMIIWSQIIFFIYMRLYHFFFVILMRQLNPKLKFHHFQTYSTLIEQDCIIKFSHHQCKYKKMNVSSTRSKNSILRPLHYWRTA